MPRHLTLHLDEKILAQAEAQAQSQGLDLSGLIEQYLRENFSEKDAIAKPKAQSQRVNALVGLVQLPSDFDEKQAWEASIFDKHQ